MIHKCPRYTSSCRLLRTFIFLLTSRNFFTGTSSRSVMLVGCSLCAPSSVESQAPRDRHPTRTTSSITTCDTRMSQSPPASFSSLPYELRSYIWSLAIDPRLIKNMRTERKRYSTVKERMEGPDIIYETSPSPAPAVVQVCRESRKHAPYERVFTRGTQPRWTWVNFEHDIFCITSVYNLEGLTSHQSQIQRLKIWTFDDFDYEESIICYSGLKTIKEFVGLREIQVMMQTGNFGWGDLSSILRTPMASDSQGGVTFRDEGSGLILTGSQVAMMNDWHLYFTFDAGGNPAGNPADVDDISEIIEGTLRLHLPILAETYEIN